MNVESSDVAFVFGPNAECGKVGRVLWPFDISPTLGRRWVMCFADIGHAVVADLHLLPLVLDPHQDPDARDLLDAEGRLAWDRWRTPPDVEF